MPLMEVQHIASKSQSKALILYNSNQSRNPNSNEKPVSQRKTGKFEPIES